MNLQFTDINKCLKHSHHILMFQQGKIIANQNVVSLSDGSWQWETLEWEIRKNQRICNSWCQGSASVNTSVIVGVLIFLTLTSFADSTSEVEGSAYLIFFTILIVIPFGLSATMIVSSNTSRLRFAKFNNESLHTTKEESYGKLERRLRVAGYFTIFGFLYIMLVLILFFADAIDDLITRSTAGRCAEQHTSYGVNESYLWRCSLFSEGSLAEECTKSPQRYGMDMAECTKLIPPHV